MASASRRRTARRARLPRNVASLQGLPVRSCVIVSFVGSTGIALPHVFADSGEKYEWGFLKGLHAVVAVKPGIQAAHALAAIFDTADLMHSYPVVMDVEKQHVAYLVGGSPLQLWAVRDGTNLWREFFT